MLPNQCRSEQTSEGECLRARVAKTSRPEIGNPGNPLRAPQHHYTAILIFTVLIRLVIITVTVILGVIWMIKLCNLCRNCKSVLSWSSLVVSHREGTWRPIGVRPTVRRPVLPTCKTSIALTATILILLKTNTNVAACGRHHKRGGAAFNFMFPRGATLPWTTKTRLNYSTNSSDD